MIAFPTDARVGKPARIPALDALRGLAVAGIVPMNVIAFSMPAAAYVNPRAYGGTGVLDTALWAVVFMLVEDKFRALFAMMFGAGVAIMLGRAGERRLGGHFARMAVLFAIGWLHALPLANNDILRVYAVAGIVLPFVAGWRPRTLFVAAGAIVAGQVVISAAFVWDWLAYWFGLNAGDLTDPAPLYAAEQRFGADSQAIAAALERGRETFSMRIERRMEDMTGPVLSVMGGLPSPLAAMLIGIAMWRNGLLSGAWSRARLLRLSLALFALSLPVLALMALADWLSGFDPVVTASIALIWSAPFDILLAAGIAALAMAIFATGGTMSRLWAQAGRMALTNYLLTSLLFAAMFAQWGLGLFGQVGRSEAYLLCALPIGAMLAISPFWLRHFRQGPAEWAWRSVAQGSLLPLWR